MTPPIRRILFIRTDRIGDVLMNLPAIRLLRQTFPKAWITVMLDDSVAELLRDHADIDEIMAVSAAQLTKTFGYWAGLAMRLRQIGFDLGIVSNPSKFLHALLFFSRIPCRIGHDRKWSFFLNQKARFEPEGSLQHEVQKNLGLVKMISKETWDRSLSLPVDPFEKSAVEALLRADHLSGKPFVAVHPGTSNPEKRWPEPCFAKLCDQLQAKEGLKVILIGGNEEAEHARRVASEVNLPVVDWTGRLNLRQLVALFHEPMARLLVSSDSGPAHIAWISGTPVVAMYAKNTRGSDPKRWGPLDQRSEVIFKAMQDITPEEVFGMVKKVLKKN